MAEHPVEARTIVVRFHGQTLKIHQLFLHWQVTRMVRDPAVNRAVRKYHVGSSPTLPAFTSDPFSDSESRSRCVIFLPVITFTNTLLTLKHCATTCQHRRGQRGLPTLFPLRAMLPISTHHLTAMPTCSITNVTGCAGFVMGTWRVGRDARSALMAASSKRTAQGDSTNFISTLPGPPG